MSFLDLFKTRSNEEKFWDWFIKNEDSIFNFERDQENVFDGIQTNLQAIHASLVFEISAEQDGKREFVVSADGIRDAFPFVESTASKAPILERWTVIKFRPRSGTGLYIEMGGLKLGADDMSFILKRDGGKIGIELFVDGFEESKKEAFWRAAFILIDTALGEFDVETKVGFIDLKRREPVLDDTARPFAELPEVFDRMYASTLN